MPRKKKEEVDGLIEGEYLKEPEEEMEDEVEEELEDETAEKIKKMEEIMQKIVNAVSISQKYLKQHSERISQLEDNFKLLLEK